eukprot:CAMPEP_0196767884 /NCGR_PEP_ID=MMETSP1095-20130614/42075_1 /TAXON_ID=96789 ORGANISM="Chromulina nebulosa, Strain UTEXLB2642" /NCGR_SAMPLE_ID=MMETSP1095 /ASSEMBLY_ACC=CAM_ASM_000446 /LENGTH=462 /DNA_ID=CAMNT_0042136673 /DNA_START=1398 /DNA_END=2782 /DNA_ORIENTATION=+
MNSIIGTDGYKDPEYERTRHATASDIYSWTMTALQIFLAPDKRNLRWTDEELIDYTISKFQLPEGGIKLILEGLFQKGSYKTKNKRWSAELLLDSLEKVKDDKIFINNNHVNDIKNIEKQLRSNYDSLLYETISNTNTITYPTKLSDTNNDTDSTQTVSITSTNTSNMSNQPTSSSSKSNQTISNYLSAIEIFEDLESDYQVRFNRLGLKSIKVIAEQLLDDENSEDILQLFDNKFILKSFLDTLVNDSSISFPKDTASNLRVKYNNIKSTTSVSSSTSSSKAVANTSSVFKPPNDKQSTSESISESISTTIDSISSEDINYVKPMAFINTAINVSNSPVVTKAFTNNTTSVYKLSSDQQIISTTVESNKPVNTNRSMTFSNETIQEANELIEKNSMPIDKHDHDESIQSSNNNIDLKSSVFELPVDHDQQIISFSTNSNDDINTNRPMTFSNETIQEANKL